MKTSTLEILEKTQLSPAQARAIVQAVETESEGRHEVLATKADLAAVRGDLLGMMADLRSEMAGIKGEMATKTELNAVAVRLEAYRGDLRSEMRGLEGRLTRWVFTIAMGQAVVIYGALHFALTHLQR